MKLRKNEREQEPTIERPTTTAPARSALSPDGLEELVRVAELTRLLKISRCTLWRWVRDGHLSKPLRLSNNVIAWRRSAIAEFLRRLENT